MNENLSQMVKETPAEEPITFSPVDLDLPDEQDVVIGEEEETKNIKITVLSEWYENNFDKFDNINQVKVAIRGVDSAKTLIMAVKDNSNEKDSAGNDKRNLRIFENADEHPVLNLPGMQMDIYNNGFRIIYDYGNNIFIKGYGVRTGLIAVFCNNINGKLIPYATRRIKKKDTDIELVVKDGNEVSAKLLDNADTESIYLLYKQSSKATRGFVLNQDAVDWLLDRQNEITDINHLLQIDSVIIDILE